jgi:hypothetical protein
MAKSAASPSSCTRSRSPRVSGLILRDDGRHDQQHQVYDGDVEDLILPVVQSQNDNDEKQYEVACRIWFQVPEGMAEREFFALSSAEREKVWADLSGNHLLARVEQRLQPYNKSPTELQEAAWKLHQKLQDHSRREEQQHEQLDPLALAMQTASSYVCHVPNLIKFLAGQEWNVQAAFDMMHAHYQIKLDLFGKQALGRDITLNDLDERSVQFLQSGAYQYSYHTRDRAGRACSMLNMAILQHHPLKFTKVEILVSSRQHGEKKGNLSFPTQAACKHTYHLLTNSFYVSFCSQRALFYQNMVLTNDEAVQRLGVVRMVYFDPRHYPEQSPDFEIMRVCTKVIHTVPIRTVAFYLVVTAVDNPWRSAADVIVLLANSFLRARTRIIHGTSST